MAAIGASSTAKRLALAYVLFKLIAASIALALFPFTIPLLVRASERVDGVTLLAGYHTAFNVVGVGVLLPFIEWFTRVVERLLPERGSPLTPCLDPAALVTPLAAEEAVRRTVARSLDATCGSIRAMLSDLSQAVDVTEVSEALQQARRFMSEVSGPPASRIEEMRLTGTLHALDHAVRLAEVADEHSVWGMTLDWPEKTEARQLCADAMQHAVTIASAIGALPVVGARAAAAAAQGDRPTEASTASALMLLEQCANTLRTLQATHRATTLSAVGGGAVSADEAMTRVDTIRQLDALAHHAWRSASHLVGNG
jgi:phosphate:Na+ symporter